MNPTSFIVLGDGLAAGASDFGLNEELQTFSFPAQVAARIGSPLPQPLIEAPGIGPVIGCPELPVRLPAQMQTTVLKEFPPSAPYGNLSIPGLRLADALTRRPITPVVHRSDALQTAVNLILGLPSLAMPGSRPPPTPLEYATFHHPTLALIALGYFDALDAAFKGDAAWIPDDVTFRVTYRSLLQPFGPLAATVVVSTIPDPADTAYFTRVVNATRVLKVEAPALSTLFGVDASDALTPAGLIEAGCRLLSRQPGPLPDGCVVRNSVIARISERVATLNAQIRSLADEMGAVVFDLHGVFQRVKREGVAAGARVLTADYLGGFYSLNGVYPGATGHGVIANALLQVLNRQFAMSYEPVDLAGLAAIDPVVDYRLAGGPAFTMAEFATGRSGDREIGRPGDRKVAGSKDREVERSGHPEVERTRGPANEASSGRLKLPPNREQVLALDPSSFYGDALRAVHTRDARAAQFGSTPNLLFGGVCLFQSRLRGSIRITFSEPENDITHFEVTHEGGLSGDDGRLVAPQWFQLPCLTNQVADVPGAVSGGDLNLATGEVSNLSYSAAFMNSGLFALVSVNPRLPRRPVTFPGQYGSAWARFEQRPDGLLDFSFRGVTFLPLGAALDGDPVRFPLPFAGPAQQFASIPGAGSALHPHIYLTTKAPEAQPHDAHGVDIPENTIREHTAFTHNTAFGDTFTLNIEEHGGAGTGRSHLQGRVQIQFGARAGDSVPVLVSTLVPGGLLAGLPESPIAQLFPGRLSPGLIGHDEVLHFPNTAYAVNNMTFVDDPFEFAIGSVDVRSGRLTGPLLYRGFIVHDMILALMQLEPRTPKSSWFFRGPARFERDGSGQIVFAFAGKDRVPYPEGYAFPQPDLRSAFIVGPRSTLDPFLYIEAMDGHAPSPSGKCGGEQHVVASNGQRFSYAYAIPGIPAGKAASFTYVNETTGGAFKMTSLLWVSFANAKRSGTGRAESDIVTFTGLGLWNQDSPNPHFVSAQISTAPDAPYVSIQIDGGVLSNVNTRPASAVIPIPEYPLF